MKLYIINVKFVLEIMESYLLRLAKISLKGCNMKIDNASTMATLSNSKESELVNSLKSKVGKADSSDKALREQTDKFEAIFIKTLLDTSLNLDNPLYPKQPGSDIYNSMFKEQLAENLSGSFGYSELLFNYLKEQQKLKG